MRLLILVLLWWLPLTGFSQSRTTSDRAARFGLEAQPLLIFPDIRSGEEYTEGLIDYGVVCRLVRLIRVGERLSITAGLGLGMWYIRQESTYDTYIREQYWSNRDAPDYYHSTDITQLLVEVPLALRLHVIVLPGGSSIYLKGGTSLSLPVVNVQESYRVYTNGRDPSLFPEGEANGRVGHLLSTGLGYLTTWDAAEIYMEIDYTWSTNAVIERGAARDEFNRTNYVRDTGIRQLGILVGTFF